MSKLITMAFTTTLILMFMLVQLMMLKKYKHIKPFNFILNFMIVGSFLGLIGATLNIIAVASNGGQMPVYLDSWLILCEYCANNFYSPHHFFFSDPSMINFAILTDIHISQWGVYSVGDVLAALGQIILILSGITAFILMMINQYRYTRELKKLLIELKARELNRSQSEQ